MYTKNAAQLINCIIKFKYEILITEYTATMYEDILLIYVLCAYMKLL